MGRDNKKNKGAIALIFVSIAGLLLFSGCASNNYSKVPSTAAGVAHSVNTGTVVDTRKVNIEGQSTARGTVTGGIAGREIGRTIGRGDGSLIAGAGGAIIGAAVGHKVEKALSSKIAQEVTVELDDGGTVVIVQELEDPEFIVGDRVAVLESRAGWSRVRHHADSDTFF